MRFTGFFFIIAITLSSFTQNIKTQGCKTILPVNTISKLPDATSKKLHLKKTRLTTPSKTILA